MSLFPLNKGLLWKEWRQNRWLFWIGMVLLNFDVIGKVIDTFMLLVAPYQGFSWTLFVHDNGVMLDALVEGFTNVPIFHYGIFAAVILGGWLLSNERSVFQTLDFLASAPVSRREILAAKYLTGLRMGGMILLVNLVYLLVFSLLVPRHYTLWQMVFYFLEQSSVLLAIYSLCFCVSTFCGNVFSAMVGSFVVLYLPLLIGEFMLEVGGRIVPDIWQHNSLIYDLIRRLCLPYYILNLPFRQEHWELPAMLVLGFLFYLLAVFLFERNSFEKNGRMLMFGRWMPILKIAVPLLLAVAVSVQEGSPVRGVFLFLIVFAVLYALFQTIDRVARKFGVR